MKNALRNLETLIQISFEMDEKRQLELLSESFILMYKQAVEKQASAKGTKMSGAEIEQAAKSKLRKALDIINTIDRLSPDAKAAMLISINNMTNGAFTEENPVSVMVQHLNRLFDSILHLLSSCNFV